MSKEGCHKRIRGNAKTGILTISTEKFSVYKTQQKIIEGYSELHQQHQFELKSLRMAQAERVAVHRKQKEEELERQ